MPDYAKLTPLVLRMQPATAMRVFEEQVVPRLTELWLDDYHIATRVRELVEITAQELTNLIDVRWARLIAAWGINRGPHHGARDKARMTGSPRVGGTRFHPGHAVPRSPGGITDTNLVPQLGAVNIGASRVLEKQAVATSGAPYFTHWNYRGSVARRPNGHDERGQIPTAVEQGLLVPGITPRIIRHAS